jgi:uncharacterized membrane protein
MAGAEPSPNRGVMIVLAYLWALAIVPLLVEKQDPEVQWHAKHGLVLMAAELVVIFAYMLITSLVSIAAIGLGCVMSLFFVFAWVGILALHVVAILKGVNGGRLIIPGISEYANRF